MLDFLHGVGSFSGLLTTLTSDFIVLRIQQIVHLVDKYIFQNIVHLIDNVEELIPVELARNTRVSSSSVLMEYSSYCGERWRLLIVTPKGGHLPWVAGENAPLRYPWTDPMFMDFLQDLENE
nr:embryogenesis-associated protein EMB8-like [Tanacetum cinerariifolium]